MASAVTDQPVNVTDSSLYLDGIPHDRFTALRAQPGIAWHPYGDGGDSTGFWAVTRHAEVKAVSKNADIYSSAIGHTNLWDLEADALEARRSLIDTDAPDHTRIRRLISAAFTPKNIRRWTELTQSISSELLDAFDEQGGGDWVDMVAAPLPIRVILSILGVPVEDADYLVELSNYLVEGTGGEQSMPPDAFGNTTELRLLPFNSPASHALFEYGAALAEKRRHDPQDDMVTMLVQAEADGEKLSPSEFRNLFHLLIFAGNETTRTALSQGAIAFAEHPDQLARLVDDRALMDTATDEVLRWSTPILHMRRTATQDTELDGTPIAAGDKVVMWYASANRDEAVFDEPFRFDVGRASANDHFAFGGGGPHFCLGAFLARLEISSLFEQVAARGWGLRQSTPAERCPSNFVHGVLSVGMEPVR
jgi:cholest-4-en-3-one 26-monooxygenase